jgi:recombination protein RecA
LCGRIDEAHFDQGGIFRRDSRPLPDVVGCARLLSFDCGEKTVAGLKLRDRIRASWIHQASALIQRRALPANQTSTPSRTPTLRSPPRNPTMDENKKRALSAALGQIEKQFGKGSVMRMGDRVAEAWEVIPTGSLLLDIALGIGGFPKGRVIEVYGPESSGKTTLTLQAIAQCQKAGGTAAFVDAEHALDPGYASKLGVNVDDLLVSQPDTGEQALEICDMLVRSNAVDMVVIDSVAALTPRAEIEGEMGDVLPGLQARLMSQALRKLTGNIKRSNCTVVFINQLRMKIGQMMPGQSPETTTGGNALKFYASVRIDIRRIGSIKKGDEIIGNQTKIKVVKNKMAPPFKVVLTEILYGEGISREGELIDMGVDAKLVEKAGAWYSYGSERIGQGKENARQYLKENPAVAMQLEAALRDKFVPKDIVPAAAVPADDVEE